MSKFLKYIFAFYINGSIHVALAVWAFVQLTCTEFHLQIDYNVSGFSFFGTIIAYNFIKYDELTRVKRIVRNTQLKMIVFLSFISAIFCIYFFFRLNYSTKIIAIGALLLIEFYTLPIFPNKPNFRNWSGVKIYLVALSWAVVTVLLPFLYAEVFIEKLMWIYFIQRFIIVFVLMLIFEIVDMSKDALSLQTIPQQLGIQKTKWLGYILLLFVISIDAISNFKFQISTIFIAFALFFATSNLSKYYTSFLVESIPIFCWIIA